MDAKLAGPTDLAGFRSEARQLLAHQVPPDEVSWDLQPGLIDAFRDAIPATASRPRNVARASTAIVPASFTRLCEFVVMHRDTHRFSLLYRLLWRLVHEPDLRNDPVDPDMLQAQHMAHAVRRDIHKLKVNLRWQDVLDANATAWKMGSSEPAHHVVEAVAPWFAKRLPDTHWVLFTPDRCVRCVDDKLLYGPGMPAHKLPPVDALPDTWLEADAGLFTRKVVPSAIG